MVIGGLQKNSLIDYPDKISCVIFTSGCNFNCPYCHNPELIGNDRTSRARLDEKTVHHFLKQREGFIEGVVLSGGEPTLQGDLQTMCRRIKRCGYRIKLDTNGSRPHVLRRLIDRQLVDYIAMDIKTDPYAYAPVISPEVRPQDIIDSIRMIMDAPLPYEFRTTCVKSIVDEADIERIADIITGADRYILQQFQPKTVLRPEFFEGRNLRYRIDELRRLKTRIGSRVKDCFLR